MGGKGMNGTEKSGQFGKGEFGLATEDGEVLRH